MIRAPDQSIDWTALYEANIYHSRGFCHEDTGEPVFRSGELVFEGLYHHVRLRIRNVQYSGTVIRLQYCTCERRYHTFIAFLLQALSNPIWCSVQSNIIAGLRLWISCEQTGHFADIINAINSTDVFVMLECKLQIFIYAATELGSFSPVAVLDFDVCVRRFDYSKFICLQESGCL